MGCLCVAANTYFSRGYLYRRLGGTPSQDGGFLGRFQRSAIPVGHFDTVFVSIFCEHFYILNLDCFRARDNLGPTDKGEKHIERTIAVMF